MKKLFILFVILGAVAFVGMAMAATDTENLNVTASVAASCQITAVTDIAFGAYDPTSSTPTDAAGNMTLRCVKATSYKTYVSGTRSMTGGSDTLNFALYSDSDRTTTFPSDNSGSSVEASSNAAVTQDIYGRIPAEQDVGVESYSATLTATVEY
ncbi:MAG: spore coat protein U domain-containing protein [Deltaproteobacteria bacterium]|nr:spore coat protein U domain-containing protein [Deltaproteobacteria bacterium]